MNHIEEKVKGIGLLRVSAVLWPDLGWPVTPQAWHKALLLPEGYEIERVKRTDSHDARDNLFELYVRSDEIPVTPAFSPLPEITPRYSVQYEQGKRIGAKLESIAIYQQKVE